MPIEEKVMLECPQYFMPGGCWFILVLLAMAYGYWVRSKGP